MTKKERALIATAMDHFKKTGGYDDGMTILTKLVNPGWENPMDGCVPVSLREVMNSPQTEFIVGPRKEVK